MARKSRKNLPQPEQAVISVQFPELDEGKIPTAIYGRLSVEDNEDNESMETQIALVQDFINRSSELNYVDTYFDNGFTGTNFKRPAFTRLMNDVRQKKIKCIVVKDLSRFGRNYLEAGYYIETVFPFLGVRLIAVNDHFDSTRKEDMESMALPIRNMVNTMYAKDISKKVWSSLQRKKEAGYAVGRQADDKCIGHQITEKLLKALVMDQLHLFIVRLSDKRKILEELRKIEDMQNPAYRAKSEVMSLTDKVGQIAKKREQLYADYVAGAVDSEEYQQIREEYSRQYDSLRTALQRAEAKKMEVEQQIREYLNMTSNLEAHLDDFGFDAQLVKSLVQRIEVSADKRIRIVFGFQDVLADFGKESAGK